MKKVNNKIVGSFVVVLILIVAATTTTAISAHRGAGSGDMVTRLAEKFGVEEAEVQVVFDEAKADRFALMQEKKEEWLNQAVADGKLTEEQKEELLALYAQHAADFDSYSTLTFEEKKVLKQEHHNEMKIWMDENGISLGDFIGHKGFGWHFAK